MLYPKEAFIADVSAIEPDVQENIGHWNTQYDMYALGERGVVMSSTTLVLMSQYDSFQMPLESTVSELIERGSR